ncbi:MAG: hypothetical protein IJ242_03270 [Clostridia bacterium]|nr:hypothetical protein [Clostridia bacterium]
MTETEWLTQGLSDAGCSAKDASVICSLYEAGRYSEMLYQTKKQRSRLMDAMHESQRRVDCMDYLILRQKKQIQSVP